VATIVKVLGSAPHGAAILVQGGPGIGKTSLTKAVAADSEVLDLFGEARRWFVPLETSTNTALLEDAVMRAIGADPAQGFGAALARLAAARGLLILDNLETPWDPVLERHGVEHVLATLAAVDGLAVFASFRGRDRIGGPIWTLIHQVRELDRDPSAELFCRIAGQSFADDPCLALFLDALAGVPLAIELVARRAFGRNSLAPLWAQWTRIGAELAAHPDFEPDRLTSLPASIELSLKSNRLTGPARRLFRLLGQLPAGLGEADRDALMGDDGYAAEEALLRVGLAVERAGRVELLPPVREHAARRHAPNPPDVRLWPDHYLNLARHRGEIIGTTADDGALARLLPELPNIEAAISTALASGRRDQAMAALDGLRRLAYLASAPCPALNDLAAACRNAGDTLGEANCTQILGDIALHRSDHDGARAALEEALRLYQRIGDVLGEANCIKSLGNIALVRSDNDCACKNFEEALQLYLSIEDVLGEANCIQSLGNAAFSRSDYDDARQAYDEALTLYRRAEHVLGQANSIHGLGRIALARSDYDRAREALAEALSLSRRIGDVLGEANCVKGLGNIALARSEYDDARKAFDEALPLYQRVGNVLGEANCIQSLGRIALIRSDRDGARRALEAALPLYQHIGNVFGQANCIRNLGDVALAFSEHESARKHFEKALTLYRKIEHRSGESSCLDRLSRLT
jgi:tetratricopeptide (TPR) repeat protein